MTRAGPGAGADAVDPELLRHLVQGLQVNWSRWLSGRRHLWSSWKGAVEGSKDVRPLRIE
jgi:hypothetical protein